jgi:hypothetical protein
MCNRITCCFIWIWMKPVSCPGGVWDRLRGIFEPKRVEVGEGWRVLCNEGLNSCTLHRILYEWWN